MDQFRGLIFCAHISIFLPILFALLHITQASPSSILDLVNPFIGADGGGNVFPGASLPYGMAKAVADTNGRNQGGFSFTGNVVTGFSHMHDSGTGVAPSLGNFPIFPQTNCPDDDINQCKFTITDRATSWINGSSKAHPGYFSLQLNNSIIAEMTVSEHAVLYRFTLPSSPSPVCSDGVKACSGTQTQNLSSPVILLELNDLHLSRREAEAVVDLSTARMTGSGSFDASFSPGWYSLYFCADFRGAAVRETGVYMNNRAGPIPKRIEIAPDGLHRSVSAGLFVQFFPPSHQEILVRIGLSFIGMDQACKNAEKEFSDFDFDKGLSFAESAWKQKLSVIELNPGGVPKDMEISFYSGIYRAMISPQDYTGENPLWNSSEPYYDSYFCIWDSFRTTHPLLTILDPESQSRMVRSLVDIYRHEGYLPDCRMSLCKGYTQGGSNADVVLAESFLKKIPGVDWNTAYKALVRDAEEEPKNWHFEGRGGLESWKNLGYIPTDDFDPYGYGVYTRSISRTVEYAYDDFCISLVARDLGYLDDHLKYTSRSMNWINMFRADQTSYLNGTDTGFVGFLQPRFLNRTWGYQDPAFCSPLLNLTSCYLNLDGHETYEGSTWLYTFYVPHDMAFLIDTLGGPQKFIDRLTFFHSSGLLDVGDEQAFLTIYLFHYAGRPGLSSHQIHKYIPSLFFNDPKGMPGNDDSGAMGAFLALAMMGLYPVHGQDVYLITPPFFQEVRIRNKLTGKVSIIKNINFDPEYKNLYIQGVTRDGKAWTKNWIQHDFFTEGGVLELHLGAEESAWGTRREDLPPSLSTGGFGMISSHIGDQLY